MNSSFWRDVWAAFDEIDAYTARLREWASGGADAATGLAPLHDAALARIRALMAHVASDGRRVTDSPVTEGLTYAFDERVMQQLPDGLKIHWPLLQATLYGVSNGGERFYALVSATAAAAGGSQTKEVLCFLLANGFVGMHVGAPEKVREAYDRLRRSIDTSVPQRPSDEPGGPIRPRRWLRASALLVAVCLAFAGVVMMTLLTNCE